MKEGFGLEFSVSFGDGLREIFVISFAHEFFTTGYRKDWEKRKVLTEAKHILDRWRNLKHFHIWDIKEYKRKNSRLICNIATV
jgi:hypothetical protein